MIDFGINYNMMLDINKIEYHDFDSNKIPQLFEDIGRSIDADYHTYFMGIVFNY